MVRGYVPLRRFVVLMLLECGPAIGATSLAAAVKPQVEAGRKAGTAARAAERRTRARGGVFVFVQRSVPDKTERHRGMFDSVGGETLRNSAPQICISDLHQGKKETGEGCPMSIACPQD